MNEKIGFSVHEAIAARLSVRTYGSEQVEAAVIEKIKAYAAAIENPFEAKTDIHFVEKSTAANGEKLGTYGFIKGAKLFICVTAEDRPDAALAVGYVFEQLVLYMTSLGLGTCWLGGTFNKGAFAQAIRLQEGTLLPILSPVGYAAKSLRPLEKIFRTSLKADKRQPAEKLFFEKDFATPLHAPDFAGALENVRLAPSARNMQPWRVVREDNAFHFFRTDDMPFMQTIDIGIALNHFCLSLQEAGVKYSIEKSDVPQINSPKGIKYVISCRVI